MISEKIAEPGFVHSLFRAGSTYFYNALKRADGFTPYHEPFHEVIGGLSSSWDDMVSRTEQYKGLLRHDFLSGSYFDEYSHILPYLKKAFTQDVSYPTFFLSKESTCQPVKSYVDCLINGAPNRPIIQCTRTVGRIEWLKKTYGGTHLYLLRNPWDQWFSYMVDPYITSTTQLIYSQSGLPSVLEEISEAAGFEPCAPLSISDMSAECMKHPLPPHVDYFLFFGLWVYSFLQGEANCDLVIDMDQLSESKGVHDGLQLRLSKLGFGGLSFGDCQLHRSTFRIDEASFYSQIEGRVMEIFRRSNYLGDWLPRVDGYLTARRKEIFINKASMSSPASLILEDGVRVRRRLLSVLKESSVQKGVTRNALASLNKQILDLGQANSEREQRISEFGHIIYERDSRINKLYQENADNALLVADLRERVFGHEVSLADRSSKLETLAEAITARDAQIVGYVQTTGERDARIAELAQQVSERDSKLETLAEAITARDAQIVGYVQTTGERDVRIAELAQQVSERNGRLETLAEATVASNREIFLIREAALMRDAEIRGRDERLAQLEAKHLDLCHVLTRRDFRVNHLDRIVAGYESEIEALRNASISRDQQIEHMKVEIDSYRSQIGMQNERILDIEAQKSHLGQLLGQRAFQLAQLNLVQAELREHLAYERASIYRANLMLEGLRDEFHATKGARWWKITEILRRRAVWISQHIAPNKLIEKK